MDIAKVYWDKMVNLKYRMIYIDGYLDRSHAIDNRINMFNALASSGSIAGWAIWNNIPYVWSIIIAVSQVFSAIKSYLPYNKRVRNLALYMTEASSIFLEYEYNWYKVANEELYGNKLNDKNNELKKRVEKIENSYMATIHLPVRNELEEKAESATDLYFESYL